MMSTGQVLLQITGSGCTARQFDRTGSVKMNVQSAALSANTPSWKNAGLAATPIDPRGCPYTLYFPVRTGFSARLTTTR
jgi:hypothetical protein